MLFVFISSFLIHLLSLSGAKLDTLELSQGFVPQVRKNGELALL